MTTAVWDFRPGAELVPEARVSELYCSNCAAAFAARWRSPERPALSCPCCGALADGELPPIDWNRAYDEGWDV